MTTRYVPPWFCTFVRGEGHTCAFCGQSDCSLLVPGNSEVSRSDVSLGICEACAVHVHWAWRTTTGDVPPVFPEKVTVSSVKVIVARLRPSSDGKDPPDPALASSYDFVVSFQADGSVDLPGVDFAEGESMADAVLRALGEVKLSTWSLFVEPLYKAHTPRGRLVSVVLCTVWSKVGPPFSNPEWRPWPLHDHVVPGMAGFYTGLEDAWAQRVWRYSSASPRTDELSVYVREAASRYIDIQQQARAGEGPDLSMLEYLRKCMSDDEVRVDRILRTHEEGVASVEAERAASAGELGTSTDVEDTRAEAPAVDEVEESTGEVASSDQGDVEDDPWPDLPIQPEGG